MSRPGAGLRRGAGCLPPPRGKEGTHTVIIYPISGRPRFRWTYYLFSPALRSASLLHAGRSKSKTMIGAEGATPSRFTSCLPHLTLTTPGPGAARAKRGPKKCVPLAPSSSSRQKQRLLWVRGNRALGIRNRVSNSSVTMVDAMADG